MRGNPSHSDDEPDDWGDWTSVHLVRNDNPQEDGDVASASPAVLERAGAEMGPVRPGALPPVLEETEAPVAAGPEEEASEEVKMLMDKDEPRD